MVVEVEEGYTALPRSLTPAPSRALACSLKHTLKSHTPGDFMRQRDARSCLSRFDNKRRVSRLRRAGGRSSVSAEGKTTITKKQEQHLHTLDGQSFLVPHWEGRWVGAETGKRRNLGPSVSRRNTLTCFCERCALDGPLYQWRTPAPAWPRGP